MKSQNVIATYIWLRIKTLLPSLGTHLRAKQDLYKNSPLLPWWKKKKSQRLIFFLWPLLTFCYWPKINWLENVQYIKKKERKEFNRKLKFGEKYDDSPFSLLF